MYCVLKEVLKTRQGATFLREARRAVRIRPKTLVRRFRRGLATVYAKPCQTVQSRSGLVGAKPALTGVTEGLTA